MNNLMLNISLHQSLLFCSLSNPWLAVTHMTSAKKSLLGHAPTPFPRSRCCPRRPFISAMNHINICRFAIRRLLIRTICIPYLLWLFTLIGQAPPTHSPPSRHYTRVEASAFVIYRNLMTLWLKGWVGGWRGGINNGSCQSHKGGISSKWD